MTTIKCLSLGMLLMAASACPAQVVVKGKIGGDIRAKAALLSLSGDTISQVMMNRGAFELTSPDGPALYRISLGGYHSVVYLPADTSVVKGYVDREGGQSTVSIQPNGDMRLLKQWSNQLSTMMTRYDARQLKPELTKMASDAKAAGSAAQSAGSAAAPDNMEAMIIAENCRKAAELDSVSAMLPVIRRQLASRPQTAVAPLLASFVMTKFPNSYEDASRLFAQLTAEEQATAMGRAMTARLAVLHQSAKGQVAPYFTAVDHNGKAVSLASLRGKVVVVDCWASWCGPCRKEMVYLKQLYKDLQQRYAKRLVFVSVSLDDRKEAWLKAEGEEQIPWISLWDSKGFERSPLREAYAFNSIPFCMVIDADGKLVAKNVRRTALKDAIVNTLNSK